MSAILSGTKFYSVIVLLGGIALSYGMLVYAQETVSQGPGEEKVQAAGITFPVAELGNCGSKEECKQYCNSPEHIEACVKFAESRGLMEKKEADQARKFGAKIKRGEGPGGCRRPEECRAFCSNVANLEACMKFAEEQGIKDEHVEHGKKILAYKRTGGEMPGGCASEESCRTYCGDFSHAEECFAFAKKAGILQSRGNAGAPSGRTGLKPVNPEEDLDEGQFRKLVELAKSGQTPGGCKSKEQCEAYCESGAHVEECVSFGEKVGFIEKDQAEKIRKIGGKGPGGCNSPKSCETYCNNPEHREECFAFAEEHGFIKKEEIEHAKEGMVRLRAGIEQAPDEVKACLRSSLGENIIKDIASGKLLPGRDIGERVRGCFEKFGHGGKPGKMFSDASAEVKSCLREKLGGDFESIERGKTMPTAETADTFRVCFQKMQFEKGGFDGEFGEDGNRGEQGRPGEHASRDFLRNVPPAVAECLKAKLGDAGPQNTNEPPSGLKEKMRACFEDFRPGDGGDAGGASVDGGGRMMKGPGGCGGPEECKTFCADPSHSEECRNFGPPRTRGGGQENRPGTRPPQSGTRGRGGANEVAECAKTVLGDDADRLARNELTAEERQKISACVTERVKSDRSPESFNRPPEGTQQRPPDGTYDSFPSNYQNAPSPEKKYEEQQQQYNQQFNQQYQQQYQQQFNQQYQSQNQNPPPGSLQGQQGFPPPGSQPPQSGGQTPPSGGQYGHQPGGGSYSPPPGGNIFSVFEWLVKSIVAPAEK